MFWFNRKSRAASHQPAQNIAQEFYDMVDRTQATIQFEPDGTIKMANENFLNGLGYDLAEIQGNHHSLFVAKDYAASAEYAEFWQDLANGKSFTDQFPRVRKDGSTIWIQATYAPVFNDEKNVVGVIKVASDITERQEGIQAIANGLEELARGNISHRLPRFNLPDLQAIGTSFEKAASQLCQSIGSVQEISATVEQTASEVGQAATELSQRTETQAATLEQTAAAIEQLTATVKAAADGASEVETSTQAAKLTAENGGDVVSQAVKAMSLIEDSSSKIAQIISVIDDIAFQTNLLALNAGVEAARAGEAGRGFAVVASEVRALAQRASDAAGEIKSLITESSGHVSSGVSLVGQAGDELGKIIEVVAEITRNISDIANGASEQAVTLNEINTGMAQLDSVTQHNAAMVEETTAASQTLASDAGALSRHVAAFETGTGPQHGAGVNLASSPSQAA